MRDKDIDDALESVEKVMKALSDPKHDHSHCWKSKNPPCGQKIEHYKCCLCEELNPKVTQTLTNLKKEVKGMKKNPLIKYSGGREVRSSISTIENAVLDDTLTLIDKEISKLKDNK